MTKTKFNFILSSFLCLTSSITAYNLSPIANNAMLSNSSITDFCQNEHGKMFIGTCDGLNIFNGRDIYIYTPQDESEFLSGNIIDNIVYTENNTFWIKTYYGLNKYDANTNTITHYSDLHRSRFVCRSQNNTLFVIRESNTIYYYHSKSDSFKKIHVSGIVFSDLETVFIDTNNILWLITKKGYNLSYQINEDISSDQLDITLINNPHTFDFIVRNGYYEDNNLYLIDQDYNLFVFNTISKEEKFIYNLKEDASIRGAVSAISSMNNQIFIGFITNGLIRLDESGNNYKKTDIDINSGIFCLRKDNLQNILWIGTDGKGVYTYSNTPISIKSYVLSNLSYKIESPVRALFIDKNNTLWIGSKGDGILKINDFDINNNLFDSNTESLRTSNQKLNDDIIYAFAESKRNLLWIGGENGLQYYSYRTKQIQSIDIDLYEAYQNIREENLDVETRHKQPKLLKYIHDIYETEDSKLWIASVGMGIVRADISGSEDNLSLTNIQHYTINDEDFVSNYFFSIYAENDSCLWFANRGYGTFYYNTKTNNLDPVNHNILNANQTINDVLALHKDDNDNLLIGTGYGLLKYHSSDSLSIFNTNTGFLNNSIHAIEKDDGNIFWLSTNRGIIHFNSNNDVFRIYEKPDGLQVTEFSDGASYRDPVSGKFVFGGINGFIAIQRNHYAQEEHYMPDVIFDHLTIFGKRSNIYDKIKKGKHSDRLELNYKQNFFTISFIAMDYIHGANYEYFYNISELSDQWINNGASNSASFSNLSPGNYTLQIKYFNRTLNKESEIYKLKFKIHPPWYQSSLAYFIYWIVTILIILSLIQYYTIREKRKRRDFLDNLEKTHQKDIFESKLRFFTNIAHEFCTPLTLISGPCERILSQKGISKFVINYVNMIQSNADRLNDLILELIEFRRIETGNRKIYIESIDIVELLYGIIDMFTEMANSKNINIKVDMENNLTWNSDEGFLATIITNLLSNAFKHTPTDKSIEIQVHIHKKELWIEIANEGEPIKEKDFKRIFDRYAILDHFEKEDNSEVFSRNGLGLAILNNMVNLLDGSVRVANTEDGFVKFTVTLPHQLIDETDQNELVGLVQYTAKPKTERLIPLPVYVYKPGQPTLLAIDNDREILWLINELFADEFNVKAIDDPLLIDNVLNETSPNIILCDINIAGLSGFELTKKIKNQNETRHIPIVLISGDFEIDQQIKAIEAGAELYINKPFDMEYLKISVKQILEREENLKHYLSSPISSYDLLKGKFIHKEDKQFLKKILKIIDDNIANENLTTKFIAEELGMGVRSLYRKMEEIGEDRIFNIIKNSRLHYASILLVNSKATIEEVIFQSGFKNKVTFYKLFNSQFGCTPKEFRERHEKSITQQIS